MWNKEYVYIGFLILLLGFFGVLKARVGTNDKYVKKPCVAHFTGFFPLPSKRKLLCPQRVRWQTGGFQAEAHLQARELSQMVMSLPKKFGNGA